ncbi:NAD(P)H-dependent oxidoreductase [Actinomyces wuliandei]|uniref:NAD(P)H-dependent oxidoreductase n=1 Tax=Actinomyces wuliandei TaxID=2057743 RepID=UPI0027D8C452|nr:NAD(P)H-dependent oxidoreductase [Actinomyces wuliandei]
MTHHAGNSGPVGGFTRDDVVAAALDIGIDTFTLGKVARRLEVRPGDLRRAVSSREDLVSACLERVTSDLRLPRASLAWPDYLRHLADALWAVLERHPGLDHTLIDLPWAYLPFVPVAKRSHAALVAGGLGPHEAYLGLDYLVATVLTAHRRASAMRAPVEDSAGAREGLRGVDVATRMWDERFGQPGGASFGAEVRDPSAPDGEGDTDVPLRPEESWLEGGALQDQVEVLIKGLRALGQVTAGASTAPTYPGASSHGYPTQQAQQNQGTENPVKTLVLVFHPHMESSRVNRVLADRAESAGENVTVRYVYDLYPDFKIDVAAEQAALQDADRIVLQFPMYWFSSPALLKQWEDDVLTYGWAYGEEGTALHGKELLLAVSPGGSAYGREAAHSYTLHELLRPFQGSARVIGTRYAVPFLTVGALEISDAALAQRAEEYAATLVADRLPTLDTFG